MKEHYCRVRDKRDEIKDRLGAKGVALSAGLLNVSIGLYEKFYATRLGSDVFNAAAYHDTFGDGGTYALQIGALMLSERGNDRMAHRLRTVARLGLVGMSGYFAVKAGIDLATGTASEAAHGSESMIAATGSVLGNGSLLWLDHNHEADAHTHKHEHGVSEHEEGRGDIMRHIATDGIEASEVLAATALGTAGMVHADQWSILVGHTAAAAIVAYPWIKQAYRKVRPKAQSIVDTEVQPRIPEHQH